MAKFVDNPSCLSRLFMVVSVLSRSFTSLASVFNIFHTFFCGDDAGPSTTNANESIPDSPKHLLVGRDSFKSFDGFCRNKGCGFSAVLISNRTSIVSKLCPKTFNMRRWQRCCNIPHDSSQISSENINTNYYCFKDVLKHRNPITKGLK